MPSAPKPALPQDLRDGRDRSPHPYARKGSSISRLNPNFPSASDRRDGKGGEAASPSPSPSHPTSSESGTEADDEQEKGAHFLKALPPPSLKPRKGLKGESLLSGGASPLLTPAQLDRDDRNICQSYFGVRDVKTQDGAEDREKQVSEDEHVLAARELFERRKRAERVRRISESALLGFIGVCVAFGHSVWSDLWYWHREVLSHVFTVAFVIAMYPLRVISGEKLDVSLAVQGASLFRRFRIPASFDPASVLYPTFVPVLVALTLLPQLPALLLPNLILGLASLPPRLFPAISRLGYINTLGWMVAIVPLVASENTTFPPARVIPTPYMLKANASSYLHPETLVLLYPLHQALLPPLNYLTTTSLLPVEKHMLATALTNLLCFAISPQACILSTLLWIGGVCLFVTCTHVLHWNLILARVPKWKFRRLSSRKTNSTTDGFLLALQELILPRRKERQDDSDADEDKLNHMSPRRDSKQPPPKLTLNPVIGGSDVKGPQSAVEASPYETVDFISGFTLTSQRRHTIPTVDDPVSLFDGRGAGHRRPRHHTSRAWYLYLTPQGAKLRIWLYACWVYAATISIVLIPVRISVSHHALQGAEPILWGLDYIFGDLVALYNGPATISKSISSYVGHLHDAVLLHLSWTDFSVPALRMAVGEANTRLLLAAYWVVVVALGVTTVTILTSRIEVDTRRKIFHATIVTMLLPTAFIDPCFCGLALSLVLALFLLLEVIRAGQVPPLGVAIGRFVAPYVDGRDLRGPMVVSHVFLLIGCAIPLWLSLSGLGRSTEGKWPGWETENNTRDVAMIAGVVCVGMGDAAASLIGRRYGRRKWPWIGGKSLEGSAAFTFAVMTGLMAAKIWLHVGGWQEEAAKSRAVEGIESDAVYWALQVGKALICGFGASFMEAVLTGANDNVVVPVALWLLVRGVGI